MIEIEHHGGEKEEGPFKVHYIFKFIDGSSSSVEVFLDPRTLNCIVPKAASPAWVKLSYEQCDNCPLDERTVPDCPVAYNIASMAETFGDVNINETSHVLVITRHRDYSKSTTLKEGLTSLMGLYMSTSGCPHMDKLKPLARLHLPFASLEENVFRTAAMYLLLQYYRHKKGKTPDWDLKKLSSIYDDIRMVNAGISRRLKRAARKESSLAALSNLDYTASLVPYVIDETLENMKYSLSTYMED